MGSLVQNNEPQPSGPPAAAAAADLHQLQAGEPVGSSVLVYSSLSPSERDSIVNLNRDYPNDYASVMFGRLMPVVLVLTLITNSLVVMVLTQAHMRTPTNLVLTTMAFVDLMTLLSPSPWYIYVYTLGYPDKFLHPPVLCYAHHLMTDVVPVFFHTSSIWLALLLATQRYIYVCHPTLARTWCTIPKVRAAIVVILVLAFAHQLTRFFDTTFVTVYIQTEQASFPVCKIEIAAWVQRLDVATYYTTYYTFRILFVFCIPSVLLITLNYLLFRALHRAEHKRTELLHARLESLGPRAPARAQAAGAGTQAECPRARKLSIMFLCGRHGRRARWSRVPAAPSGGPTSQSAEPAAAAGRPEAKEARAPDSSADSASSASSNSSGPAAGVRFGRHQMARQLELACAQCAACERSCAAAAREGATGAAPHGSACSSLAGGAGEPASWPAQAAAARRPRARRPLELARSVSSESRLLCDCSGRRHQPPPTCPDCCPAPDCRLLAARACSERRRARLTDAASCSLSEPCLQCDLEGGPAEWLAAASCAPSAPEAATATATTNTTATTTTTTTTTTLYSASSPAGAGPQAARPAPPPRVAGPASSARTIDSNRTTLMLFVVITVFLLVELPAATVTIVHVVLNTFDVFKDVEVSWLNYVKLFTNFFIMISYSVNFYIYCSMSKKFRETFWDLILCRRNRRNQQQQQHRLSNQNQQQQHSQVGLQEATIQRRNQQPTLIPQQECEL